MSSITDTNSNSNTIDLRALLESGQSIDHIPTAFKQMHSIIKKLEAQNKELKKQEYKHSSIYVGVLQNKIIRLKEENEELKEANDTFTLGAKRTIESNCKLYKENQELKEEIKLKDEIISLHES
tara:strand:- start:102 stop:473 length:372 start_codon:yes stop_codon:yes gene_type:complete